MKIIRPLLLLILTLILGLSHLHAAPDPIGTLTSAQVSLGFDVFKLMMKETNEETVLFSPQALQDSLGAIHLGARIEAYAALDSLMRFEGIAPDQFYMGMSGLHRSLRGSDPRLSLNSSILIQSGISVRPEWITNVKGTYGTQVSNVNLHTVKDLRPLTPLEKPKMMLLNTTTYQGVWGFNFDKTEATNKPFKTRIHGETMASMMQKTDRFDYLRGNGFQAVCLPFSGHRLVMVILLPDTSLNTLLGRLNAYSWVRWMALFKPRVGTVCVPKLHLASSQTLDDPLRQLGLGVAYTHRANFGGIGENLCLTSVVDSSCLDTDITCAPNPTRIDEMDPTTKISAPPFLMILNRPFFFAIRDTLTGGIVLMGVVGKPS